MEFMLALRPGTVLVFGLALDDVFGLDVSMDQVDGVHDLQSPPDVPTHVEVSKVVFASSFQHHLGQGLPQFQAELDFSGIGDQVEPHRGDELGTDSKGRQQLHQAHFFEGLLQLRIELGMILLLPHFVRGWHRQCLDGEQFPEGLANAHCAETPLSDFQSGGVGIVF